MEQNEKERLDLEKLVMKMDIEERTRLLNILAAQTSVISNMNPNAYVDSATLQVDASPISNTPSCHPAVVFSCTDF
jgi:hypothetical protein